MLAYSVFSLRLSEDVPSQSDSIHLISLYLTVCMFFSLSAMTWFAFANKLREKKRLPSWIRWLALKYIARLVCANNMHRKAMGTAVIEPPPAAALKPSPVTSTTVQLELVPNANHCPTDRSASTALFPGSAAESGATLSNSPSTVWIRRSITKTPSSSNGPEPKKAQCTFKKFRHSRGSTLSKSQESLYALAIINRLVFFIFLSLVITFNIHTWFIYSRTVGTKLADNQTLWTCFDESSLSVVNCTELHR